MLMSSSRLSASEHALARTGTVVQKYRIERLIGIGGLGAVYRATNRHGHHVAIKFLLEQFLDDPDIRHLFGREAYAANRVPHPGAVPVLDDDVYGDGCPFLIMPFLKGESVHVRWSRATKRLPLAEVAVFMLDVLDVLSSAHAHGVVHRDIKPGNIFATDTGYTRLLNFGIARCIEREGGGLSCIGTRAFMAPELTEPTGEPPHDRVKQGAGQRNIGPHSDQWSAGATLFSLMSGRRVHEGAPGARSVWSSASIPSLAEVTSGLPASLVQAVDRALAVDPAERWPSVNDLRAALVLSFEEVLHAPIDTVTARVREKLVAELGASGAPGASGTAEGADGADPDQPRRRTSGPMFATPPARRPSSRPPPPPSLSATTMAKVRPTMAYEYVGSVCLVIHSAESPSDTEWERDLPGFIERWRSGAITSLLVYSDGGGPTLMQRNRMRMSRVAAFECPIAIITRSKVARGIATAVRWFRPTLGVFSPERLRDAFEHLNLPASEHDHLARRVFALRSELASFRDSGLPPRHTSGRFPAYTGESSEA